MLLLCTNFCHGSVEVVLYRVLRLVAELFYIYGFVLTVFVENAAVADRHAHVLRIDRKRERGIGIEHWNIVQFVYIYQAYVGFFANLELSAVISSLRFRAVFGRHVKETPCVDDVGAPCDTFVNQRGSLELTYH